MDQAAIERERADESAGPSSDLLALRGGAALQQRPARGLLVLTDSDRIDFIQRMTTNDVVRLGVGEATVTVLTSPVARILFVFTVLKRDDALWLLPAGDDVEALARHLKGQIFFMDKVKLENRSGLVRRMRLMGPEAATVLAGCDLPAPDADAFVQADGVTVLHQQRFDVPGYELIVPGAEAEALRDRLLAAGAMLLSADPVSADAGPDPQDPYTVRRIELGRPGYGAELREEFTPLETDLAWTCAENKGCYTGQEIIARQITYDKVTRTLVGLRSAELLPAGESVSADGRPAGTVTSSALGPEGPLALAVVKRPHNEIGSSVEVSGQQATVVALSAA